MKKILNEWRKFLLKESSFAPKIPYSEDRLEPNYSLYVYEEGSSYYLVLYRKEKYVDDFYIIGYTAIHLLSKSGDKNCIPETYHMTNIYVEQDLRKQGFGQALYDLAFAIIPEGAGLTSDKSSGTQPSAARKWNNFKTSSGYEKRKTEKGNNVFDYNGKETPDDPMDDCNVPMKKYTGNASHHSFAKKDNSSGKAMLAMMRNQHEKNDFMNKQDVEERLLNTAIQRFLEVFGQVTMDF